MLRTCSVTSSLDRDLRILQVNLLNSVRVLYSVGMPV